MKFNFAIAGILLALLIASVTKIDASRTNSRTENVRQELLIDCMIDGAVVIHGRVFQCAAFPTDGQPIPERAPTLAPKKGSST
jgi:hypothetical protein